MKKILTISALMLSLVFVQAPAAIAGEAHWGRGCPVEKITHKLNLNTEQKVKVKAILAETRKKIKPIHEKIKALRPQTQKAFIAGDKAKQSELANDKKELVDSIMDIREEEQEDISAVLTEAQRAKFVKLMNEWKAKHNK
jgi:Spy/CpxP family protein refolding chaperone